MSIMIERAARLYRELVSEEVSREFSDHPKLIQQLLYNRGLTTKSEKDIFLYPDFEKGVHDPFLLTDMEKSVERILKAMSENEHIVIYTDYDCDGIPGGVLLHDFFTEIGYTDFENYIPHRH